MKYRSRGRSSGSGVGSSRQRSGVRRVSARRFASSMPSAAARCAARLRSPPAGADREEPVVRQVGRQRERVLLVLAARVEGLHRAVRPDEVQGRGEVALDGVPQVGAAEDVGEQQQRGVGHVGGVDGAALRVEALRVDVDAFGEPLLDAVEETVVGEGAVQPGQGGAQFPAVVRGVHPAGQQALGGGTGDLGQGGGDLAQFRTGGGREDVRVAHVVDGERGVRRRLHVVAVYEQTGAGLRGPEGAEVGERGGDGLCAAVQGRVRGTVRRDQGLHPTRQDAVGDTGGFLVGDGRQGTAVRSAARAADRTNAWSSAVGTVSPSVRR